MCEKDLPYNSTVTNGEAVTNEGKELAGKHWNYLQTVIELHYRTAFEHGFKHGIEYEKQRTCKGCKEVPMGVVE